MDDLITTKISVLDAILRSLNIEERNRVVLLEKPFKIILRTIFLRWQLRVTSMPKDMFRNHSKTFDDFARILHFSINPGAHKMFPSGSRQGLSRIFQQTFNKSDDWRYW